MLDNSDLTSLSSLEDGVEPDLMMVDDPCSPSSVSSASSSIRIRMKPEASDCQLSWTEHQSHLTDYFDSLFRRESLVDVTLICPDRTVRAHRVVLSACSSYLGSILADNPSHHPDILLPDVAGWELEALVRFMYRGEIEGVTREDLPALIRVAETLQVRGLTTLESSRPREPSVYLKKDLFGPSMNEDEHHTKMSRIHQNGYSFDHTSPLPRRKQARPRRRSGDSMPSTEPPFKSFRSTPSPVQDAPEDLSVKKSPLLQMMRQESEETFNLTDTSREETPLPSGHHKAADSISVHSDKSEFSLAERNSLFSPGPSGPLMTPNSLLSMTPIHHQSDRRKGQHSAPRGGPPRAWTNGDLTEALNHVWNRKMTTSQASRVFGIPYNSLLMYVRGKYGKSLKLDTLRKETLEGEAMALAASTRGSYKLAAAAAAAAAAATKGETAKPAPPPATSTTTSPPSVTQPNHNNNNNNNNNNNKEPKLSNKMNHYGEMESLGGFSAAGLAAGGFAPNPFLSYFCDFTFPGHHLGGGGGGHHLPVVVPGGMLGNKRHHRPMEKKIDLHPSSSDGKRNKEMPDMEEEDGPSPPPLRLGNRSLLPLDLPQPGHV